MPCGMAPGAGAAPGAIGGAAGAPGVRGTIGKVGGATPGSGCPIDGAPGGE